MAIQDASDCRPCGSGEGHHTLSRLLLESPTLTEHLLWATRCPRGIFLFARLSVLHYSLSVPHRPEHQSLAESGSVPLNPVTTTYPPLHPDTLESSQVCPRPCPQQPPTPTPKYSLNPPTSHLSTSAVLSKMPSVLAQTSQSPPQPSPRYTASPGFTVQPQAVLNANVIMSSPNLKVTSFWLETKLLNLSAGPQEAWPSSPSPAQAQPRLRPAPGPLHLLS